MKFVITYDPANKTRPLNLELPKGTNPMFAAMLLSQIVTVIVSNQIGGSGLILPAANLPKVQ